MSQVTPMECNHTHVYIRKKVLTMIQSATFEFVRQVCRRQKLSQHVIDNAGGKIFTFGSFRLGVFGPGTFCVGVFIVM